MTEAEMFDFACWIYQTHFGVSYPMVNESALGYAKCCRHIRQCVQMNTLAENLPFVEDINEDNGQAEEA